MGTFREWLLDEFLNCLPKNKWRETPRLSGQRHFAAIADGLHPGGRDTHVLRVGIIQLELLVHICYSEHCQGETVPQAQALEEGCCHSTSCLAWDVCGAPCGVVASLI